MTAQTSTYLRQYVLEHVLQAANHDSPANLYVALFLEDPTEAGTGQEVDAASYARREVAWDLVTDRSDAMQNNALLSFPAAVQDWGLVTHWGVYDALTAGNLLYYGRLNLARNTEVGVTNVAPAGTIVIDASGADQ